MERPYLRPLYDEPAFIVRNVWRLYGGWWDGDPARLHPPDASALSREVCALAGGARAVSTRAKALADAGELALACALVDHAARCAPDDDGVIDARREIYERRAAGALSLMARGVYSDAARRPW
ncbi:MAG: alkyl sulfatase dimerization domain-containing protein [Polyangiales bacterium]